MKLNPDQMRIISVPIDKPLLITAGAGTGKTATLIQRTLYLMQKYGVKSDQILLLTFTRKAANEMKERIVKSGAVTALEKDMVWIHTFHGFCARILKEEAHQLNLPPDFEPLSQSEQAILYKQVYAEFLALEGVFKSLDHDTLFQQISLKENNKFENVSLKVIEKLRDRVILPSEYMEFTEKNIDNNKQAQVVKKILAILYTRFDTIMEESGYKDFSKLITDVINLLKTHDSIRRKYQNKFSFIMVDEFQDTNHAQYELLQLIAKNGGINLTVVGDPRQSIYQWRGADPSNLPEFEKSLHDLTKMNMTINYRSNNSILTLANKFLAHTQYASLDGLVLPEGTEKKGDKAVFLFENNALEPDFIAEEIKRLLNNGYKPSDIVILFRSLKQYSGAFERALANRAIPFYTCGSNIFFERDEIIDLTAYFRLIANPLDKNALIRLLLRPPYSLSDAQIYSLQKDSIKNKLSLFEQIQTNELFQDIYAPILSISSRQNFLSLIDIFFAINAQTTFLSTAYRELSQSTNVRESLSRFMNLLQKFNNRNPLSTISEFIEYFQYAMHDEQDTEELELFQSAGCVRLMTLHKSKGLEFPCVFLSGIDIGEFMNKKKNFTRRISKDNPFLFNIWPDTLCFKETNEYNAIKEKKAIEQVNELIRLYYVGITRAQNRLYITGKNIEVFRSILRTCPECEWIELYELPECKKDESMQIIPSTEDFLRDIAIIRKKVREPICQEKGKVSIQLSCSTLHEFEKDPYQFYLRYILHKPQVVRQSDTHNKEVDWMILGTIIHEAIDDFHTGNKNIALLDIARYKLEKYDINNIPDELLVQPLMYYEMLKYRRDDQSEFYSEYYFSLYIEDADIAVELRGQMDRVYVHESYCKILDFKTGFLGTCDEYRFQMALYALACTKLFGVEQIEAELIFLHQQRCETMSFNKEKLAEYERKVLTIANRIFARDFSTPQKGFSEQSWNSISRDAENCSAVPYSADSYYRHFYRLITLEQETCVAKNKIKDIHPLEFSHIYKTENIDGSMIVEFNTDTYFIKIRRGDGIHLITEDEEFFSAEVIDVGHHFIRVATRKNQEWSKVIGFREWHDSLPFERMKDNLLYFIRNDILLKSQILGVLSTDPPVIARTPELYIGGLDEYQKQAVEQALNDDDILIVHGPPGTGKTLTIAYMVQALIAQGKRIVLSALTNRAVDAMVRKVLELNMKKTFICESDIVRVGRKSIVDSDFRHLVFSDADISLSQIGALIHKKKIVFLTAASIHAGLFWENFDAGIVDEASQMPEPFALGVVNHVKKLILVGDNQQLPPIISDACAAREGFQISLFERLKSQYQQNSPEKICMLKKQYRMNEILMKFCSDLFYDGQLLAGNECIASSKYYVTDCDNLSIPVWLGHVIDPDTSISFVNIISSNGVNSNVECICDIILKGFVSKYVSLADIGIISALRNEVALLRKNLPFDDLVIDTVDRFQGSDKKVIILSCSQQDGKVHSLLTDPHRFNVALTRAESKMIIVGSLPIKEDAQCLFKKLIMHIKEHGIIIDYNG